MPQKNGNYYELVDKNYGIVYDHFKEQDQLRNTSFGFFTTLSVATLGFIEKDNQNINVIMIFLAIFVIGILFSLLLCRYKYYGNIYSITMKILRKLYVDGDDVPDSKYIQNIIDEKAKVFSMNLYSADFIIFLCLIMINCLNLLMFLTLINIKANIIIFIVSGYVLLSIILYKLLVVNKAKKCKPKNLSFIDTLFINDAE